jgi:hypothetical protein
MDNMLLNGYSSVSQALSFAPQTLILLNCKGGHAMGPPLLRLKYHDSIADAVADLGKPDEIGKVFFGFQKYLYSVAA